MWKFAHCLASATAWPRLRGRPLTTGKSESEKKCFWRVCMGRPVLCPLIRGANLPKSAKVCQNLSLNNIADLSTADCAWGRGSCAIL